MTTDAGVDLFWIPLGARGEFVRRLGQVYEAVVAARERRPRRALYHTALEVHVDGVTWKIEMAIPAQRVPRGVVAVGPVGAAWLGRWRWFRYEVRCIPGSPIPAVPPARGGPVHPIRVGANAGDARRVLALVPEFPIHTWGRDELRAGEMWNSNSMVSWLLTCARLETTSLTPPPGGRAPGWDAGIRVAARSVVSAPPLDATRRSLRGTREAARRAVARVRAEARDRRTRPSRR